MYVRRGTGTPVRFGANGFTRVCINLSFTRRGAAGGEVLATTQPETYMDTAGGGKGRMASVVLKIL